MINAWRAEHERGEVVRRCRVLLRLAMAHADDPEYQAEWAP